MLQSTVGWQVWQDCAVYLRKNRLQVAKKLARKSSRKDIKNPVAVSKVRRHMKKGQRALK